MPNYSLTPTLENFVAEKVRSGGYNNASEVVREALRLLQHREAQLADLDASLEAALQQADDGQLASADDVFDKLSRRFDGARKDSDR